jgi:hypothetical protein
MNGLEIADLGRFISAVRNAGRGRIALLMVGLLGGRDKDVEYVNNKDVAREDISNKDRRRVERK